MKEPLDKIILGDFYSNEYVLDIAIYEEFITLVVSLKWDESNDALERGGVPAERLALNSLLNKIFNKPFDSLKIFSSEIKAGMWANSVSFEIPYLGNGGWSKTAFIILDSSNFEASLNAALSYVKGSFNHFINPREKKENIAKSMLSKYFTKH